MKTWVLLASLLLTGCWSSMELTERSFVMAVALDKGDNHNLEMTTQVYKAISQKGAAPSAQAGRSYINVKSSDTSVFEAVRNLPIQLGRKAQWSHMRAILIGEELARENVEKVLDFFYRDHEPRLSTNVVIARGKAGRYLELPPLHEYTSAQQIRENVIHTFLYAAKTVKTDLRELAIQLRSETETAVLPYLYMDQKNRPHTVGVALLHRGKMVGVLDPAESESLLMLTDQFDDGLIEFPCGKQGKAKTVKESLEVFNLHSRLEPQADGDNVTVAVSVSIEGGVGELQCTAVRTPEDERALAKRIEEVVEEQMRWTIAVLQKQKIDAIGVGNRLYAKDPAAWKKMKREWPELFSRATFHLKVNVKISQTGNTVNRPVLQENRLPH